jgi:hypothetical protein
VIAACDIINNKNALDKMEKQIGAISVLTDLWWVVERCFNFKPDLDPFEFILANMKDFSFPVPRRCWKKKTIPFYQENLLEAA